MGLMVRLQQQGRWALAGLVFCGRIGTLGLQSAQRTGKPFELHTNLANGGLPLRAVSVFLYLRSNRDSAIDRRSAGCQNECR